ncbi:ANTAR domain-containing protein [Streptomyces paromomycinus]|uniref:Transcriptional regulator n=1 Tax=Streptomyces paromomycinus TaxID=92743 RepID=A0A401VXU6_STREY|nr:ANTAR domain-containing protein [Streptomyces paromomycinus]GCD41900.1 transcriptional regulator [Streptomyces paromomycinus]
MPEPAPSASPSPGPAATGMPPPGAAVFGPHLVAIEVTADGDRTSLTIKGELDWNTGQHIEPGLHAALAHCVHGLDLRLSSVRFCDCAGLGLLLDLRRRALALDKTLTITATSRAVERILDLSGTRDLFETPPPNGQHTTPTPTPGERHSPQNGTDQELCAEVSQLRRAMQTRPVIDLARGILMATFNLTPEAAWTVLVTTSQKTNTKLHRLAQDLLDSHQGTTLPDTARRHLTDAIAAVKADTPGPPDSSVLNGALPRQRNAPPPP